MAEIIGYSLDRVRALEDRCKLLETTLRLVVRQEHLEYCGQCGGLDDIKPDCIERIETTIKYQLDRAATGKFNS